MKRISIPTLRDVLATIKPARRERSHKIIVPLPVKKERADG